MVPGPGWRKWGSSAQSVYHVLDSSESSMQAPAWASSLQRLSAVRPKSDCVGGIEFLVDSQLWSCNVIHSCLMLLSNGQSNFQSHSYFMFLPSKPEDSSVSLPSSVMTSPIGTFWRTPTLVGLDCYFNIMHCCFKIKSLLFDCYQWRFRSQMLGWKPPSSER